MTWKDHFAWAVFVISGLGISMFFMNIEEAARGAQVTLTGVVLILTHEFVKWSVRRDK